MRSVLYVSDQLASEVYLRRCLDGAHLSLAAAVRTNTDLLTWVARLNPDFLLVDVDAPTPRLLDALETLVELASLPVVMLSRNGDRHLLQRAEVAGVAGVEPGSLDSVDLACLVASASEVFAQRQLSAIIPFCICDLRRHACLTVRFGCNALEFDGVFAYQRIRVCCGVYAAYLKVGNTIRIAYGLSHGETRENNQAYEEELFSMLVRDIMTNAPKTVSPDAKLLEVVSLMCLFRFSGLPVVEDGKVKGIVAEKDVLHRMFPGLEDFKDGMVAPDYDSMLTQYKDVVTLKVADVMTSRVITVDPDMHILKAATVMIRHKFRRIPVAEDGELLGMLSLGDIHKAIFQYNISSNMCGTS